MPKARMVAGPWERWAWRISSTVTIWRCVGKRKEEEVIRKEKSERRMKGE